MKIVDTSNWYVLEGTLHERIITIYDPLNERFETKTEQTHFEIVENSIPVFF